jgi:WD repeat and SOF domain-containing protein 1
MWDYSQPRSDPVSLFQGKGTFTCVDSHREGQLFATSGSLEVALWDQTRAEPIQTFSWGADTVNSIRFNQAETSLLASCSSDRSLMLHDTRTGNTISKVVLKMRSNAVSWNPQEAVYLSVANEDSNVYTFDMRYFDRAVNIMQGHVSAVIDLDYSPTGQEIVTGGYDRSMRIYNAREGQSRDIYHTMRMQRLFCVRYSMDSKYILSGSDDGNVRIWKAQASEQLGTQNHRQREAIDYNRNVLTRFKQMPEVRRIANHRSVPKDIKKRSRQTHEHRISQKRRDDNVRRHSKPGSAAKKNLRDDAILEVKK